MSLRWLICVLVSSFISLAPPGKAIYILCGYILPGLEIPGLQPTKCVRCKIIVPWGSSKSSRAFGARDGGSNPPGLLSTQKHQKCRYICPVS